MRCIARRRRIRNRQSNKINRPGKTSQEFSVEELLKIKVASVYSASKYWQKVTEAPSSVTIITADEIQKYGYRTLADILRSVRGL